MPRATAQNRGRPARRAVRPLVALACALALAWAGPGRAEEPQLEYGVKAVFLERFARFVEWPGEVKTLPFRIEVVGDDPFHGLLERAYASRTIRGRPVTVRHPRTPREIGDCDLIFVAPSVAGQLPEVLARVQGRPVLVVGDTPGLAEAGAHLNFFTAGGTVRFEVNPEALRASGLSVSYLLLQVARVVTPAEGGR